MLLVIVPGFVYQGVRGRILGPIPAERELSVRLLRAVAMSGALALVYIAVFGSSLTDVLRQPDTALEGNVRLDALIAFGLVFVVPALLGLGEAIWRQGRVHPELKFKERMGPYDPTPTAWDFGFRDSEESDFIRVLTKNGDWCGGRVGKTGFFTGYPETRELFLETAYLMDPQGSFGAAVSGSQGVWIDCSDAQLVQRISANSGANEDTGSQTPEQGASR